MIYLQVSVNNHNVKVLEKSPHISNINYKKFIKQHQDVLIILNKHETDDGWKIEYSLYKKGLEIIEITTLLLKEALVSNAKIASNILNHC